LASKVKVETVKFKGHTLKGTIEPLYQLSVNKVRQYGQKFKTLRHWENPTNQWDTDHLAQHWKPWAYFRFNTKMNKSPQLEN